MHSRSLWEQELQVLSYALEVSLFSAQGYLLRGLLTFRDLFSCKLSIKVGSG
jgi:hypothetical protein